MAWAIYLCFVLCFVVLFWFVCGFAELDAITLNDDGLISLLKTMDKCNFQPVRFLFLFYFSSSTKAISRNDYNSFLKKPITFLLYTNYFPSVYFKTLKTQTHTHIFSRPFPILGHEAVVRIEVQPDTMTRQCAKPFSEISVLNCAYVQTLSAI